MRRNNPDLLWLVRLNAQGQVLHASHAFLRGQRFAHWRNRSQPGVLGPTEEWLAEPPKLASDDSWQELRLYLPTPELPGGGGLMAGIDLESLSWLGNGILSHTSDPNQTELFLIDADGGIVVSSRPSRETHLQTALVHRLLADDNRTEPVITSYSIHYTKLYESISSSSRRLTTPNNKNGADAPFLFDVRSAQCPDLPRGLSLGLGQVVVDLHASYNFV